MKDKETEYKKDNKEGLVIINTGGGKGKTTAALGLALRAAGHGQKVLILQFIKGAWKTGESKIMKRLTPEIEMEQLGKGFIKVEDGKLQITEKDIKNAEGTLLYAKEKINSGKYDMVILDEINNIISYGLVDVNVVLDIIKKRPVGLDLVLTGRGAPDKLIDIADTVSEIREIKHAYSKGIKAKKGIEY
ncbi:MAG: cob(I)yrinic acid a,c-diamide adenosyltransferase [Actinobacteria bacterium]|nr:cob(I)yrinic acid a,c-diamide adenosyltransferase [Actinomycetota bacterium]